MKPHKILCQLSAEELKHYHVGKSRENILDELEILEVISREQFERYEGLNPPMKGHWE